MKRLACLLGFISLLPLALMLVNLTGETATIFSFLGFPSLALALVVYFFARWREGGFHGERPLR